MGVNVIISMYILHFHLPIYLVSRGIVADTPLEVYQLEILEERPFRSYPFPAGSLIDRYLAGIVKNSAVVNIIITMGHES